jgi:hypothetical protein
MNKNKMTMVMTKMSKINETPSLMIKLRVMMINKTIQMETNLLKSDKNKNMVILL